MTLHPLIEPHWMNAILPELVLCAGGLFMILLEAFFPRMRSATAGIASIIFIATVWSENWVVAGVYFGGTYEVSAITLLFDVTFVLAAILATLLAGDYLEREGLAGGEFYALLMWGTVGMMMMAKGLDLLLVVLGLELLSICIFVLLGYHRRIAISNEASLKYFLMGAFATGFILYGTALFYGASQTTNLKLMGRYFATADPHNPMLTIAFVLLLAGLGFKLAAAPFHPWAPDVYQGAPTPVAGWLSVAPKAATLIALMRIFSAMAPLLPHNSWMKMVAALSVLSMIVGNAVAIAQRDLKRMLAYSGIAHIGYMLIAMLNVSEESVAAVMVYTMVYAFMNIGAFGVVSMLAKNQNDPQTLDDVAGLGFRRPFYGLALTLCMFSLSGLPPTAGFVSKFAIFKSAVDSGYTGVALTGILTSIVSVYYYLRVVYYLYMREPAEGHAVPVGGIFATGALVISMVGIIWIGILPQKLFEMATAAARVMLSQ